MKISHSFFSIILFCHKVIAKNSRVFLGTTSLNGLTILKLRDNLHTFIICQLQNTGFYSIRKRPLQKGLLTAVFIQPCIFIQLPNQTTDSCQKNIPLEKHTYQYIFITDSC